MKKYWLGVLLMISMQSWAAPGGFTPAEVAMCEALGMPSHGGQYQGHYCEGLIHLNRAYSSIGDKRKMGYNLSVAIDNFNYELSRPAKANVKRGEVHVNKARALKLMGRNGEAAAEFNKALSYKLYTPDAYQALADHFREAGNKQKALEMVSEGLKHNPNSRGLKRRYTELGGKLPYPQELIETPPPEESNATGKPKDEPESIASEGGIAVETADPKKPITNEPTPLNEPAKIGSPKNPYCRFCPD